MCGSDGKKSTYNSGDSLRFDPWVGKIPKALVSQVSVILTPNKPGSIFGLGKKKAYILPYT